jgi:LAO/AO transport system kinase
MRPPPELLESTAKLVQTLLHSQNPWEKRLALSRAITLVENRRQSEQGDALLMALEGRQEQSLRVGVAGSPGAGKSTFLEKFGQHLLESDQLRSLAVLCVDPSSPISGGSILGDKTRMPALARDPRCFVRASASQCVLGGLAPQTESVARLVSAVYDVVFIETVGLGQSEVDVSQVVDVMLYLTAPHAGDDLQAVKKGILEMADLILITKADAAANAAKRAAADFYGAQSVMSKKAAMRPPVLLTSAVTGEGIPAVWQAIEKLNGTFLAKRCQQDEFWTKRYVRDTIMEKIDGSRSSSKPMSRGEKRLPPRVEARMLVDEIWSKHNTS